MDNTTQGSNKTVIWTIIAIVIIALLGWWIYGVSTSNQATDDSAAGGTVPAGSGIEEGAAGGPVATSTVSSTTTSEASPKTIVISAQNYSFSPNTITVNKGDTVTIELKNAGGFHDLKIDAPYNVATKRLQDGQSETISFVADTAGSFEYYCSVGQHRQMGMKGTLIVN
jgi:plastocyanin